MSSASENRDDIDAAKRRDKARDELLLAMADTILSIASKADVKMEILAPLAFAFGQFQASIRTPT